jgi:phosphoesterase RecJ-like protein
MILISLLFLIVALSRWSVEKKKSLQDKRNIGIYTDTGGFKHSYTTARTLKIASLLAEVYPHLTWLVNELENSNPKGKLYFDALALNSIETFYDDTVAISTVSFEEMQKRGIKREESDNNVVASMLLGVKEWGIGVTIVEKAPGEVSVSLRSKERDVSEVAKKLGGGGHRNAAGANLLMTLAEAKRRVIDALHP